MSVLNLVKVLKEECVQVLKKEKMRRKELINLRIKMHAKKDKRIIN